MNGLTVERVIKKLQYYVSPTSLRSLAIHQFSFLGTLRSKLLYTNYIFVRVCVCGLVTKDVCAFPNLDRIWIPYASRNKENMIIYLQINSNRFVYNT